jgi:Methyltransferase domain
MEASEARDVALLGEHLRESLERLPGPAYYNALKWIHRTLEPANYIEIGVHKGVSLVQANDETLRVGIDPAPNIEPALEPEVESAKLYRLTSDEFFERHDLTELLGGPVELAFIDGLHLFEQVLRDFVNLEKHSGPGTVVLLHDCVPLDAVTADRERTTDFYSGDVWKATLALRRRRRDLDMVIVPTAPTGLVLVRGLDASNAQLEADLPGIVDEYMDLDFDYYLAHRDEMPQQIANSREAVSDWLSRAP